MRSRQSLAAPSRPSRRPGSANQAALFSAPDGDMAGRSFGVIDVNSDGDYQAGSDYVFEFVTPVTPIDQVGLI